MGRAIIANGIGIVLVLAVACAPAGGVEQPSGPRSENGGGEFEALYEARTADARTRFSEADVAFVRGMIGHHAQALEMAALAPRNGAGAAIQTLAARVLNGQRDEIATMERWLRDRGQAVPSAAGDHAMADHSMHGGAAMPGMLTPEQMAELAAARGAEFDRLFLTRMIQHHRGAVTAVQALFATDGALQDEELFKIASDVQVDQTTEVARMERMLEAMQTNQFAP